MQFEASRSRTSELSKRTSSLATQHLEASARSRDERTRRPSESKCDTEDMRNHWFSLKFQTHQRNRCFFVNMKFLTALGPHAHFVKTTKIDKNNPKTIENNPRMTIAPPSAALRAAEGGVPRRRRRRRQRRWRARASGKHPSHPRPPRRATAVRATTRDGRPAISYTAVYS